MFMFRAIGACLISTTLNHVQYKNEPVQQYTTYTHTTNLYTYWTHTTRVEPIPIHPIHIPLTSIHTGHIQLGLNLYLYILYTYH